MIKSFRHRGLERFFEFGTRAGINPDHAPRLRHQLAMLDVAKAPADVNLPGWRLHKLSGALQEHWSLRVSGNWRLIFCFEDEDVTGVDYLDYHA